MNTEMEVVKQIRLHIAQRMAFHGDNPAVLMNKLEMLVLDWFYRGLAINEGKKIYCPNCRYGFHF